MHKELKNKQKKVNVFFTIIFLITSLISYSQDGSLDLSYNSLNEISGTGFPGGSTYKGLINSFSTQTSGKIIIGGNFTSINGSPSNRIARLNTDGTLDTSFNVGLGITGGRVESLVVQPDDKIIVLGTFNSFNGNTINGILRLNSDGTVDTSFNVGTGIPSSGSTVPRILKLKSNGQIVVVSNTNLYNSTATRNIFILNSNGAINTSFNPNATDINGSVWSMEIQNDDKIIIYLKNGTSNTTTSTSNSYIKRLNTNGSLDNTFTINSTVFLTSTETGVWPISSVRNIHEIKQQSDGKILIGGDFNTVFGQTYGGLARLNSNGSVDNSFTVGTGIASTSSTIVQGTYAIYSINIQTDNKIIIGGSFPSYNNIARSCIARLNTNGNLDTTFNPGTGIVGTDPRIKQLKLLANNRILVAGTFDSYNNITRRSIARLNGSVLFPPIIANDDVANIVSGTASTPIANVRVNDTFNGVPATSTNTVLSSVSSTNTGITLNTSTGAINVAANVIAGTYTLTYKICQVGNTSNCDTAIVTINITSPPVTVTANDDFSYATSGTLSTAVLNVRANDLFSSTQATSANTSITLVSSSNPGITLNTTTGAITVSSSVLVGSYALEYRLCSGTICDNAIVYITVYPPSLTSVAGIRASGTVTQIDVQSNGKIIIAGNFITYNNITANFLARLNSNLTLDTTFLATGPQMAYTPIFLIQPDDKILMVFRGVVNTYNGQTIPNGIVRLNANGSIDNTFNVGGTGILSTNDLSAVALQSDGKILIGGRFMTTYNGQSVRNLIRLNSDGTIDNSFTFGYSVGTSYGSGIISEIVIQPDGKIIVGGNGNGTPNGQPNIVRLNSNGSIDTSFTFGFTEYYANFYSSICTSCLSGIQDIELQPDGKIIIVGGFPSYNGSTNYKNIVRLNSNGTVDTTFNIGTSTDRVIKNATVDNISGKIYIGGEFTTYNNASVKKIIRLNSNGLLDSSFNTGTATADSRYASNQFVYNNIHAIKLQSDGKLIIGGNFTSYNGISATNITRLLPAVSGGQGRGTSDEWQSEPEIDINKMTALGDDKISFYPNPSNGIFTVNLENVNEKYETVEVYNLLGEKVFSETIDNRANVTIDLSQFSSGYYIAKVKNEEKTVQLKLIKQ